MDLSDARKVLKEWLGGQGIGATAWVDNLEPVTTQTDDGLLLIYKLDWDTYSGTYQFRILDTPQGFVVEPSENFLGDWVDAWKQVPYTLKDHMRDSVNNN